MEYVYIYVYIYMYIYIYMNMIWGLFENKTQMSISQLNFREDSF